MAHTTGSLLVRFDVSGDAVRAVCTEPNGPVWEDDCVEFFVKSPQSRYYYNFETNCIGVGLSSRRLSRDEFEHFSPEKMSAVMRRASLPKVPLDRREPCCWSVELEIPFSVLDCGDRPETLLANFYKCGNRTAVPHFLSWNPVLTPKPDFHRPEYFGKLQLEW